MAEGISSSLLLALLWIFYWFGRKGQSKVMLDECLPCPKLCICELEEEGMTKIIEALTEGNKKARLVPDVKGGKALQNMVYYY